jgi:hypothetical protein
VREFADQFVDEVLILSMHKDREITRKVEMDCRRVR